MYNMHDNSVNCRCRRPDVLWQSTVLPLPERVLWLWCLNAWPSIQQQITSKGITKLKFGDQSLLTYMYTYSMQSFLGSTHLGQNCAQCIQISCTQNWNLPFFLFTKNKENELQIIKDIVTKYSCSLTLSGAKNRCSSSVNCLWPGPSHW